MTLVSCACAATAKAASAAAMKVLTKGIEGSGWKKKMTIVGVQAGVHSAGKPGNVRKMRDSEPSVTSAVARSMSGAR